MRRLRRALRRLLERMLGRLREGPAPPARFMEEARLFALSYPEAGAGVWEVFAARLAEKAYGEGWVRGYEWREQVESGGSQDDAERHGWSLTMDDPNMAKLLEEGDPSDPLRGVPAEGRAEFFDVVGRAVGTHRVVLWEKD